MWLIALLILVVMMVAAYKSRTNLVDTGLGGVNEFYDFVNSVNGTPFTASTTATGTVSQEVLDNRSTLVALSAISAGDGAAITAGSSAFSVTTGEVLTIATDLSLGGLSTTPGSVFKFGTGSTIFIATGTADAYFLADRSISNFWVAVRTNASGTTSTVTAVPLTLSNGTGSPPFTRLKIISTIDRSLFFIDAVLVATITNRAWAAGNHTGPTARLTTAVNVDITTVWMDYVSLYFQLASTRPTP